MADSHDIFVVRAVVAACMCMHHVCDDICFPSIMAAGRGKGLTGSECCFIRPQMASTNTGRETSPHVSPRSREE